jgi:hypothetical protein
VTDVGDRVNQKYLFFKKTDTEGIMLYDFIHRKYYHTHSPPQGPLGLPVLSILIYT